MTTLDFTLDPDAQPDAPAPAEGAYVQNTDHVGEGVGHLIDFFRKTRNVAELSAYLSQVQELEDALWALRSAFDLDAATGQALAFLGALWGEPKLGRTDTDYRAAIRARQATNRSNGQPADIFAILQLLAPDCVVWIDEYQPAAMTVTVTDALGQVTLDTVSRMLQQAKAAGVRLNTVMTEGATEGASALIWAESDDIDVLGGWGNDTDTSVGGSWSSAI